MGSGGPGIHGCPWEEPGSWGTVICPRVLKGRLASHRKMREQGGWLKSLGDFGEGPIGPLDKSEWAGGRGQQGVRRGGGGGEGGRFGMVWA